MTNVDFCGPLTGVDFHICGNRFTMGTIQIGSEVKNGSAHLNGLFPWNQVHEKYECGHSWWL